MLHPSYTELIAKANEGVEPGDEPVVQSRYSIVCAAAKRGRQLMDELNASGDAEPAQGVAKPLSDAVAELDSGKIYIMSDEEYEQAREKMDEEVARRVEAKLAARAAAQAKAEAEAAEKAEADNNNDDDDDDEFIGDDDDELIDVD